MADKQTVAVLGAGGTMGLPIARNLARSGHDVRAWNRTPEKSQPLSDHGAYIAEAPADAAAGADVLLTMLADADAVIEATEAAVAEGTRDSDGVIWLQMSTIGERGTARCIDLAAESALAFLDAPVLGTKKPAHEGELVIMASGPRELEARLGSIFDAIAARTMWVGDAGAGTKLKIATASWILAVVEGSAETFALAESLSIDPRLVLDAVRGGPLDMAYLQMKGHAIIERDFEPSFKLALAAKDAALVEESAERHELALPLISTIRRRLEEGVPEHGDEDFSATFLTSARS